MIAKPSLPVVSEELFAGLVGEVVATFERYTEADPVAIAAQFLVALGNVVGRGPHFFVGETRHSLNENVLIVGESSRSRKGDSKNIALRPFADVEPAWFANTTGGLSSGEGVIHAVRDAVEKDDKKGGRYVADEGVADKRLLIVETEFASVLKQFTREGNILSCTVRDAWDGKPVLRTLTKNSPARATDAHISIIAHTTPEDLGTYLASVEAANGLGNRFLSVLAHRAKLLPEPGRPPAVGVEALVRQVRAVVSHAGTVETLSRTENASALWCKMYPALTADHPGLLGSLLARSEAHVARLSALYALSAKSKVVDVDHLRSALAFWDYVEASTKIIFAGRTGNDDADRVRAGMIHGQSLTLSEIRDQLFSNHISAGRLAAALKLLEALGEIATEEQSTGGRPAVIVTRTKPDIAKCRDRTAGRNDPCAA